MAPMDLHLSLRHLNHPPFPQLVPAVPFSLCLPLKTLPLHSAPSSRQLPSALSLPLLLPCLLLSISQFLLLLGSRSAFPVLLHFPMPSPHPSSSAACGHIPLRQRDALWDRLWGFYHSHLPQEHRSGSPAPASSLC